MKSNPIFKIQFLVQHQSVSLYFLRSVIHAKPKDQFCLIQTGSVA